MRADRVVQHGSRTPTGPKNGKFFIRGIREVGCIVQIHKVVEKASGNVARCSREGAAVCRALELPTWMFDRAACAPMRMDARPRVIPRYDLDQS